MQDPPDIIEISSSPESSPKPAAKPLSRSHSKKRALPLFLPDESEQDPDIIELTDTEEEEDVPTPNKKQKTNSGNAKAGPSTKPNSLFVAGSSKGKGTAPASRAGSSSRLLRSGSSIQIISPSDFEQSAKSKRSGSSKPVAGGSGNRTRSQAGQPLTDVHNTQTDAQPPAAAAPTIANPIPDAITTPRIPTPPPRTPTPPLLDSTTLDWDPTPPPEAAPAPQEPKPLDIVTLVCEVIPDVSPAYVRDLSDRLRDLHPDHAELIGAVLHNLFEDPTYPKDVKGKGKEKEVTNSTGDGEQVDYASKNRASRGGPAYGGLALEQLYVDFPEIPEDHVITMFTVLDMLYAPTYFFLREEQRSNNPPYVKQDADAKQRRVNAKKKGKRKAAASDEEFAKERQWLLAKLQREAVEKGGNVPAAGTETPGGEAYAEEEEGGIECGCCFTEYPFRQMIQCPDAHLFCTECVTSFASTKLGEHNPAILCMDQSGCTLPFPDSELRRILSAKLWDLYERVRQSKEVDAAGLEGLEECPFCEYKVLIECEFEQEKLLRCRNEECGKISCRKCKKEDHLPKSCEEVDEDKKLQGQHAIDEAMTRALTRSCPKCRKAFIKDAGCNKMTCPYCHTLSCYVCRQVVTGYEHFHNGQPGSKKNLCPLWENVDQRHADEVAQAAKKALEDYKRDHPDVNPDDIKVDLPVAPPPQPGVPLHLQAMGVGALGALGGGIQYAHHQHGHQIQVGGWNINVAGPANVVNPRAAAAVPAPAPARRHGHAADDMRRMRETMVAARAGIRQPAVPNQGADPGLRNARAVLDAMRLQEEHRERLRLAVEQAQQAQRVQTRNQAMMAQAQAQIAAQAQAQAEARVVQTRARAQAQAAVAGPARGRRGGQVLPQAQATTGAGKKRKRT